jgi:hypothetical protein
VIGARPFVPAVVREFTHRVAAAVAAEHADDPLGELVVWLHLALRREASVGEIYGVANLERRLAEVRAPDDVHQLMRLAIGGIWAQEKAHAAYLQAMLMAIDPASSFWRRLGARLDGVAGALEGYVLSGCTSPSQLMRAKAACLLAVGRQVQDVPGFVSSLGTLSFGDFCRFNAELEITAVDGYQRMLALLHQLAARGSFHAATTLLIDIGRMIQDERFHNLIFLELDRWFARDRSAAGPDGDAALAQVALRPCAARLAAIREQVYGTGD